MAETVYLFVHIAEQMIRFYANVRTANAALEERPKVSQPWVLPLDVMFCMVNDLVSVLAV